MKHHKYFQFFLNRNAILLSDIYDQYEVDRVLLASYLKLILPVFSERLAQATNDQLADVIIKLGSKGRFTRFVYFLLILYFNMNDS